MTHRWIVRGPTKRGWFLVIDTWENSVDSVHTCRRDAQTEADWCEGLIPA